MASKDLAAEFLKVDNEIKSVDQQMATLKQHRRKLLEKKDQLEKALKHSVDTSENERRHVWESESFSWSANLKQNLKEIFQMDHFRDQQLSAMNASLSREDVILIMSTGGGKSLSYQLPATINDGFTLVVSPLISLMDDQLMALKKFSINGALLNQSCTQKEITCIQESMLNPKSDLKLVFVTPEKLAKSKRFMSKLEKSYESGRLQRIAIDEVHCCSQWGHDFRPDYKFLNILRRVFPNAPILGLTATATSRVIDDVKNMLNIPGALTFRASFNRKNLFYEVRTKPNENELFLKDLVGLIKSFNGQSGIVYCFSKKETDDLADSLKSNGIKSASYHADLSADVRSKVHQKWYSNHYQIIVATVAFGMGIDKPDVRFVIHQTMSKSVENYYQESGRAGRDDLDAVCVIYYRFADIFRQSSMICTEKTGIENLFAMVKYCQSSKVCRRKTISDHFGEHWSADWCQSKCDNCINDTLESQLNVTTEAKMVIEILKKTEQKLTGLKVVESLTKASSLSRAHCEKLIVKLLLDDYLKLDFHFTPYNIISYLASGPKAHLLDHSDDDCRIFLNCDSSQKDEKPKRKKRKIVNNTADNDDLIEID